MIEHPSLTTVAVLIVIFAITIRISKDHIIKIELSDFLKITLQKSD